MDVSFLINGIMNGSRVIYSFWCPWRSVLYSFQNYWRRDYLDKKCKRSENLCLNGQLLSHDFSLLDDTPSKSPNFKGFKEHRHDQAIFTLLCLKYNVPTLSSYEYWYPKASSYRLKPDWNSLKDFPIHAKRDIDLGILHLIKIFVIRLPRRLLSLPQKMLALVCSTKPWDFDSDI